MTKAERIFNKTKYDCKKHLEVWGKELNPDGKPVGFTCLSLNNEPISIRTCNAVQKLINSEKGFCEIDLKLGLINQDKYNNNMYIIDMLQVTLDNTLNIINSI